MKEASIVMLLGVLFLTAGCATKKYVNEQVVPIINKVNTLDQLTAENTHQISAVSDNTTQQISDLQGKTSELEQKAAAVSRQSEAAGQGANGSTALTDALIVKVKNFDNYQSSGEVSLEFPIEGSQLNEKAKTQLDNFAATVPNGANFVFTVTGNTDSAGSQELNYELSKRRAGMAAAYLASKFHIPPYRIFCIGLGSDKPLAANTTRSGRAKNRRVDVALFTTAPGAQAHDEESSETAAIK